jgi:Tol biopolymer transport system component
MALTPGEKVGPYEILAALGAGGMGEVYRARDSRLERDVAIKVLPHSFASDPDRLRRFQQEARALAALNHPNIVGVYEVGEYRDSYYMVSELLEGETLRDTIAAGPLSQRRAIEYASQVAEGLATAHDKGVVHRDLKPENIFVTQEGRVKILDFGLAKLAPTEMVTPGEGATATVAARTTPGMVLGTAGYMSPEQVRGKEVDTRTDIFAFGAILYEILSGRRAFKGESSVETMNAILKDDPPELEVEKLKLSPGLERIVRRCLEKEPSRRFQSARDVGFALEAISGTSSASAVQQQVLPPERPRWFYAAVVALLFVVAAAAAYLVGKRSVPAAANPSYHQLTFETGYAGPARFTRDGNTVLYSAAWNGGTRQLYSQRSNSNQGKPLGLDADVLGIADNGDMALILKRRFLATWLQRGTLARMPIDGGAPRPILDDVYDADISRDGKDFAVVRREGGGQHLEFPIGKVLFTSAGWISDVRISPDASEIAFMDHPITPDDRGAIAIVDRQGNVKRLTQYYSTGRSLCWSPDGKEIWFTAAMESSDSGLYAVSRGGKIRTIARMPVEIVVQDISATGRVLFETVRYQIELGVKRSDESRAHDLANFVDLGGMSPDGQWLVYNDFTSGDYEALARKRDGGAIHLGQGYGDGITWDGSLVPAARNTDVHKLYLYPTGVGEQRVIDLGGLSPGFGTFENDVTFSRDGRWGLLSAFTDKGEVRDYLFDTHSGNVRPVTPVGSRGGKLSPDATQVVALNIAEQKLILLDIASGKARDVIGVEPDEQMLAWNADGRGIVVSNEDLPAKITNVDLTTGKRQLVQVLEPLTMLGSMYARLVSSADGKTAAYRHRRGLYAIHIADDLR